MSANHWEGERVRLRGVDPADWEHFQRWQSSAMVRNDVGDSVVVFLYSSYSKLR